MSDLHYESPAGVEIVRSYFKALLGILSHPVVFFRSRTNSQRGISSPLAFALVTHWIATSIEFLWSGGLGLSVPLWKKVLDRLHSSNDIDTLGKLPWFHQTQDLVMNWFWGAGSVIADPFIAAAKLVFSSFFIFIGAKILIDPNPSKSTSVSYESILSIICFATSATIIRAIPWIGSPLSILYGFVLVVIGLKETYHIGTGRSLAVALFPKIILVLALFFFVAVLAMLAFGVFQFLT